MKRIVIELYDHTPKAEAEQFVAEIVEQFQPSNPVWYVDLTNVNGDRPLAEGEIAARQKVWEAARDGKDVTLSATQAEDLWRTVLQDSVLARAIRKP